MSERDEEYANKKYAREFYNEVRNRFKDQEHKFKDFITAFEDCKEDRDIPDFATKMQKILKGHEDLMMKINALLPDRYKIEDKNTIPKKRPNLEDAKNFLRKIRAQFQGVDDHIYKSLVVILYRFYRKVKSFNEVCQEVTTLLKDHPDLLDEFTQFLPEGISIQKTMRPDIKEISNSNGVANTG
ncbi:hypothetical protein TSUD_240020 [Trifolium subterraneum]|uniref:Uncharacterized protein n=1 Tax=Trifolium subterraneum TaxID=3900 RepID=A0A2Z6NRZ5_TRISU|nr:hypothetical protein TSUD_240020 [Trifolium subterraneum]